MLDILVCPDDKRGPLELFECAAGEDGVNEGALYCAACGRFYMITSGIPVMLPDSLRDRARETEFLREHASSLPSKIVSSARPWHA